MAKNINKLPSLDYLNACFEYEPSVGTLKWKKRQQSHFNNARGMIQFNDNWPGKVAGIKVVRIGGVQTQVRRIIWKMVYGEDPNGSVYNINGITGDDRIDNLAVKSMVFGDKVAVKAGLPEGLEYDRERIMWGSRYIGWFNRKIDALGAYEILQN